MAESSYTEEYIFTTILLSVDNCYILYGHVIESSERSFFGHQFESHHGRKEGKSLILSVLERRS